MLSRLDEAIEDAADMARLRLLYARDSELVDIIDVEDEDEVREVGIPSSSSFSEERLSSLR